MRVHEVYAWEVVVRVHDVHVTRCACIGEKGVRVHDVHVCTCMGGGGGAVHVYVCACM